MLALAAAACSSEPARSSPPVQQAAPKTPAGRTLVVGKATAGAIITLDPTPYRDAPLPTEPAVMDQYGLAFNPDLLLARVGQRVEFRSSEDVLHNVRVADSATNETIFNVATPPNQAYTHVFEKPGYYEVTCDVHPAMRANVFVTSTPYAGLADDQGAFTFANVEPGAYKAAAVWGGRRIEQVVEVAGARTELNLSDR